MEVRGRVGAALLLVGGLAVGLGPLFPWVEVLGRTAAGTGEMIGWLTIFAGLLLVVVGANAALTVIRPGTSTAKLFQQMAGAVPLWAGWAAWLTGVGVTVGKWIDIQRGINEIGVGRVGSGLWLQLVGSIAAIAGLAIIGRNYVEHSPEPRRPPLGL